MVLRAKNETIGHQLPKVPHILNSLPATSQLTGEILYAKIQNKRVEIREARNRGWTLGKKNTCPICKERGY